MVRQGGTYEADPGTGEERRIFGTEQPDQAVAPTPEAPAVPDPPASPAAPDPRPAPPRPQKPRPGVADGAPAAPQE